MCLSGHSEWQNKVTLSRHWEWRDQRELPRHQVKNAVLTGLGHTMARQRASVAPVVLARQAYSVCTTTACTGACTTTACKYRSSTPEKTSPWVADGEAPTAAAATVCQISGIRRTHSTCIIRGTWRNKGHKRRRPEFTAAGSTSPCASRVTHGED